MKMQKVSIMRLTDRRAINPALSYYFVYLFSIKFWLNCPYGLVSFLMHDLILLLKSVKTNNHF